jgi:hypothetical protein
MKRETYEQGWNDALQAVWQRVFPRKAPPEHLDIEVLEEAIETAMAERYDAGVQAESEAQSW